MIVEMMQSWMYCSFQGTQVWRLQVWSSHRILMCVGRQPSWFGREKFKSRARRTSS